MGHLFAHVRLRPVADIRHLGEDVTVGILNIILPTLALLVCNLIYCGQRIMADLRHSRRADVTWGSLAFYGALMAVVSIVWATASGLTRPLKHNKKLTQQ